MPKAVKKTAERQRKEKFSNEELMMLTETLAANANVVFSNDMQRETILKKKAIWAEAANKVSAVGTTTRTVKDCRKRWDDLWLCVRNMLTVNRNLAMGTGESGESPLKLREWEEICASTIGVESIAGVGEMEHGVATSSDGGSQTETENTRTVTPAPPSTKKPRRDATGDTATTSRVTGRSVHQQRDKGSRSTSSTQPEAMPAAIVAPTAVCSSACEISMEGTHSAATSSDEDEALDIVDRSHTPSPTRSIEASPRLSSGSGSPGASATHTLEGAWCPQVSSPDASGMDQGAAVIPPARSTQHDLAPISKRQAEITGLVGQHVAESARLREDLSMFARQTREGMEACTNRICNEMAQLRQAMIRIADAIERRCPPTTQDEPGTSSSGSSRQTRPLRRSLRNLRRTTFQPPNGGGGTVN
ncbi:uncharacterized protein [Ambystoma mexicanum]|uniref:uncharacterized protein n=1 Tax=Ambystoma mexicanum TaxID=8296 RepID=UPI0037E946DC